MDKENILLLNPPSDKICIRDYFCSKTSRSGYLFPPVDLLILSGWLAERCNLTVMDAVAEKINFASAIEKISQMGLKAVVTLVGAASWESDIKFLKKLKKVNPAKIICIGDVILEEPRGLLEEFDFLDAILLDFTTDDLWQYLSGNTEKVKNMVFRVGIQIKETESVRSRMNSFNLPVPRHELFINKGYRFPFVRRKKFTVVLTDFGCPFGCLFCVMPSLGFKYREVDNVILELEYIRKLGIKEIFFLDQSFGAIKERNLMLCGEIVKRNFDFGWVCFSRIDLLEEESLKLMKQAGCHTIIFGVESGDPEILKAYNKSYDLEKLTSIFKLCRKLKIRTVGTFILGLPEDTRETCRQTIDLAKKINCDFASFHVAVPRAGTALREKARGMQLIEGNLRIMDQAGASVAMPTQRLGKAEVLKIRKMAVREFYLRPGYLFRRFSSCASLGEFLEQFREGLFLLRNMG